jgi:hypothetical protein
MVPTPAGIFVANSGILTIPAAFHGDDGDDAFCRLLDGKWRNHGA